MPELPEVETIRRGLTERLVGRRLDTVWRSDQALRKPSPVALEQAAGRRILGLHRHAKVTTWDLEGGWTLVSHLGMTGKFLFHPSGTARAPHTHAVFHVDGDEVHYLDARRFGWLALHAPDDPPRDTAHYGIDALDRRLDDDVLDPLLRASRAPLKAFLLDQTKIAGLGNIYACEALWRAGLSPRRLARNTPRGRVPLLRRAIVEVLQDSLAAGGTSFNDYVDSIGREGSFLFDVAVFRRAGGPCPRCGAEVRRIVQSGRSTFYCPGCQR